VSEGTASCTAPSFSPDGEKLVWNCYDLHTGSSIWMSDGEGYAGEVLLERRGAKSFTWRSDSKAFLYAGLHVVNRFNIWSDVYMHNLGSQRVTSLTGGARARDPDFSPDGSRLVMVTNKAQNNQLEVMTVDRRRKRLTHNEDHTQYSTPRYSPDGKALLISIWRDGRRDLWILDKNGKERRRLTADVASDRDGVWSADGRHIYFTSDRSGIPNIYAIDTATEHLWQVTNVVTGAANPSPNPTHPLLAYQQYSHDGWDIRVIDLDPADWIDRGALAVTPTHSTPIRDITQPVTAPALAHEDALAWAGDPLRRRLPGVPTDPLAFSHLAQAPSESIDSFDQGTTEDALGDESEFDFHFPERRYNPLPALLPRYWLPNIQLTPYAPSSTWDFLPASLYLAGATGTSDPLRFMGWNASGFYRTDVNFFGGGANLTINRYIPVYAIGASHRAVPYGGLWEVDPEGETHDDGSIDLLLLDQRYWERRSYLYASMSYPYTHRTTVFARYSMSIREELFELPEETYLALVPVRGRVGAIEGGWRFSWSRPTAYAISTEDGRIFSLVGSLLHPLLGTSITNDAGERTPLTQVQVTSEIRQYWVNPWIPNHVLAVRGAGGVTFGPTDYFGTYNLGGSIGDGAFYATPDEFRMLRGYPIASDSGNMYWLGGVEYRLPLMQVHRGAGVLPAYLRNISAAAFMDAGNAFNEVETAPDVLEGALVGAGAEIRTSFILGWALRWTGRFGYGIALNNDLDGDGSVANYGDLDGSGRVEADEREGGYKVTDPRAFYFQLGGSF
jgi:hypothetical protein